VEFATGDCMMMGMCPADTYVPATVHMDTFQF
jgi:hypothetical protein